MTIQELGKYNLVKEGDTVICCTNGFKTTKNKEYGIIQSPFGSLAVLNDTENDFFCSSESKYVLKSSSPKTWKDLSDEEKGVLLLAYHDGKTIEFQTAWSNSWYPAVSKGITWFDDRAFRVKPEPVVEKVTMYTERYGKAAAFGRSYHSHKITWDLVNGEIDCSSVKMRKL